jgi:hypothetical protein
MPRARRLFLLFIASTIAVSGLAVRPAGAASISVIKTSGAQFGEDAPDPFILRSVGGTYYAYTTGTSWGNHIGILKSSSATGPYHTITSHSYGSSAFPSVHYSSAPAAWQVPGTLIAPGVARIKDKYVLYYSAKNRATGEWCLSMATSSHAGGPFTDHTGNTPWYCNDAYGGAVDPSPYIGKSGSVWLLFKSPRVCG